jgi:hypothetical protein
MKLTENPSPLFAPSEFPVAGRTGYADGKGFDKFVTGTP